MAAVQLVADLHVHSRFSRATSAGLDFVALQRAALAKGIGLVGTGDFTHPGWMEEVATQLEPAGGGFLRLRPELARAAEEGLPAACAGEVRFVLEVEISCIYKADGRVRKNHNLVFVPSLEAARGFSERLAAIGNLASDGRPILGLDAHDLLEITLETDPLAFLVPAHIWTPWFSLLGSKSGFDSVEACFRDLAGEVFALETGLSSDPPMNWRLAALDRYTLVSSSDAHSAARLGREANLFELEPSFDALLRALRDGDGFAGTIELYPEEGKYHLDGHRKCGLRLEPEQTRELGGRCPRCGGILTVGVMSRVLELADRPEGARPPGATPFESLVPLDEVVAQTLGVGPGSKAVRTRVERLRAELGPELPILRGLPLDAIAPVGGAALAEAIRRVRSGELEIAAGFDGQFGEVTILAPAERERLGGQLSFFPDAPPPPPAGRPAAPTASPTVVASIAPTTPPEAPATARDEDPLEGLDHDQLEAALAEAGPLLVVAGPGSGKTRTLVAHVLSQIRSGRARPEEALVVTFTNQAAEELEQRLEPHLADGPRPLVTTFHGLGLRLLDELGERPTSLLDDQARRALVAESAGAGQRVERLAAAISLAKQSPDPEATLFAEPELHAAYTRYEAALAAAGAIDVDDLVLRAYQRLEADPDAVTSVASRFPVVAVDEYQDVNDVQAALVALLAPAGRGLVAIGDPEQAIYGFRGARPGHFRRFAEAFPGTHVVHLTRTYRLTRPLLAVARAIVGATTELVAERDGPPVELVACPSAASEGEQVVVRLERLLGGTSLFAVDSGRGTVAEMPEVGLGDVAVLSRTRAQRGEILAALERSGIPARSVGEDEAHDPRSDKVAVMTMHAAKGREHEVVFVTGVEEGLVPLTAGGRAADPDEERRLLYVAVTRARRLAVMSHAAHRRLWGERLPGRPSPFLADLPEGAIVRREPQSLVRRRDDTQLRLF